MELTEVNIAAPQKLPAMTKVCATGGKNTVCSYVSLAGKKMDIREKHVSWTHVTWKNLPPPSSWDTSWGGNSKWAVALWEHTLSETLHSRLSPTWSRMSCALLQGENTSPLP